MDGSDKLEPIVVGTFRKPGCFRRVKSLPLMYRHNRKAWMRSDIFEEWLLSLDSRMCQQKCSSLSLWTTAVPT